MAADAFKVTARGRYVDAAGTIIPGQLPTSLQMSADDIAGNKLTFDDYDSDKYWQVGARPPPEGAVAFRFEEYKPTEDGADTTRVEVMLGNQATGFILRHDTAFSSDVTPAERLQGLDNVDFPIGTRISFKQLA